MTLEGQPDQDVVALASPAPKSRLHQVETLGDQPDQAVVALDSPTPEVDLTKMGAHEDESHRDLDPAEESCLANLSRTKFTP